MTDPTPTRAGLTDERLEVLLSQHEAGNVGAIHQLGNHLTELAKEVRDSRQMISWMRRNDKSLHEAIEKLVQAGADVLAEREALRERAEAAEQAHLSLCEAIGIPATALSHVECAAQLTAARRAEAAAWNDAIEAAEVAYAHGFAAIRALRRAAPTEGEA